MCDEIVREPGKHHAMHVQAFRAHCTTMRTRTPTQINQSTQCVNVRRSAKWHGASLDDAA